MRDEKRVELFNIKADTCRYILKLNSMLEGFEDKLEQEKVSNLHEDMIKVVRDIDDILYSNMRYYKNVL